MALLAGGLAVTTSGAADGQDVAEQAKLIRHERVLPSGKTRLVEFTNEATGRVEYRASVGLRAEVAVVSHGEDGVHEIEVKPYDPVTEAEMDAMAANLTREVFEERVILPLEMAGEKVPDRVRWMADELYPETAESSAANRAAPSFDAGGPVPQQAGPV